SVAMAVAFALMTPATALAAPVRLMVDPGHGGKDPGAVAGGLAEKDSNLRIGKMVAESARRQGWDVESTRDDDRFIALTERPRKAKAWKADAMVSIHSNSAGSKPTGHMTIHRSASGKRLGNNIMSELGPLTDYEDIGNRSDSRGLAVLRQAKVPTVIVELLSVSSPEERKVLKDPAAQREMAEAIVRGVAKHHNAEYVPPAEPKAEPEAEPEAEPKAEPKAEPGAEKDPGAKPDAEPAPEAEPKDEPKAEPKDEPADGAEPDAANAWGLGNLWRLLFG
ncbi:MAG: N-acetylmuramoyl-L-alanine amidase, partial [Coriobacteriia bacterium]|nr:N-acetylmuramoyl-L-alanine amidase [Coriobacteriia bacterium]